MSEPILPGATLGVLGGGQLGRMFVHAAQAMGYGTAVLDPDAASPAGLVAHHHVQTPYLDRQGLASLVQCSAAITTEFENVPAGALAAIGVQRPVAPSADAVSICQHRVAEKAQFARSDVQCASYAAIDGAQSLAGVDASLLPGLLKTSTLGYDGKGQQRGRNERRRTRALRTRRRDGQVAHLATSSHRWLAVQVQVCAGQREHLVPCGRRFGPVALPQIAEQIEHHCG